MSFTNELLRGVESKIVCPWVSSGYPRCPMCIWSMVQLLSILSKMKIAFNVPGSAEGLAEKIRSAKPGVK